MVYTCVWFRIGDNIFMKNLALIWFIIFCLGFILFIYLCIRPLNIYSLKQWFSKSTTSFLLYFVRIKYIPYIDKHNLKRQIKRYVRIVLSEVSDIIIALKSSPAVLFLVGMSITISLSVVQSNVKFGQEIVNNISVINLGLIAIFMTVATFITTISRQSYDRSHSNKNALNSELRKYRKTSKEIFIAIMSKGFTQLPNQSTIVEGYAAATVFDQDSYQEFVKVLRDKTNEKFNRRYWLNSTSFLNIARAGVSNRPYAIKNLICQWDNLEDLIKQNPRINSNDINKILDACYKYEISGNVNYYNHRGLLNIGFTRAVFYGLVAVIMPMFYSYIKNFAENLPFCILLCLSLTYSLLALLFCIRYLFKLISYLHVLSPYRCSENGFFNFYDKMSNTEKNEIIFKKDND